MAIKRYRVDLRRLEPQQGCFFIDARNIREAKVRVLAEVQRREKLGMGPECGWEVDRTRKAAIVLVGATVMPDPVS